MMSNISLVNDTIYYDTKNKQEVEFRYMGQNSGLAIVCDPGDSGGGMQSCWGVDPNNLTKRISTTESNNSIDNLTLAENALRDIMERCEHSGTWKKMLESIKIICNNYIL